MSRECSDDNPATRILLELGEWRGGGLPKAGVGVVSCKSSLSYDTPVMACMNGQGVAKKQGLDDGGNV